MEAAERILSPADVDAIADAIMRRMSSTVASSPIPVSSQLWSAQQCADYLSCGARHFQERIAKMPGFPQPIRAPLSTGGRSRPKYRANEVIEYCRINQIGKPSKSGGRPRGN